MNHFRILRPALQGIEALEILDASHAWDGGGPHIIVPHWSPQPPGPSLALTGLFFSPLPPVAASGEKQGWRNASQDGKL